MSNMTVAESKARVHLSLFTLRQMWIDLAEQIDGEPAADAADDAARLAQLNELEAEIMAAPVEAGEDWAALVDLAGRTEWQSRIGEHLEAVAIRVLDQTRRQDRMGHVRNQLMIARGFDRMRDEFGAVHCRLVLEAETAAEVAEMFASLKASSVA